MNHNFRNIPSLKLSPLRLHSARSLHIPNSDQLFQSKPIVSLPRLKLHSANSFVLPSTNVSNCFHNGPRVTLSPLSNALIRKYNINQYTSSLGNRRMYPSISKCNSKRCRCCNYLSCNSTIKSSVNGRIFSINLPSNID